MSVLFGTGDLVTTRLKNRWGIECLGTIESANDVSADVCVWNLRGPGANVVVTDIPIGELDHFVDANNMVPNAPAEARCKASPPAGCSTGGDA